MARRRMYLFERAYVDYAARIRAFARRLLGGSGRIWDWFWRGAGATIIEVILRLCVVASAIGMAVLYMQYEARKGRSFSISTLGVILIIVVYVGVLLWGWKAPVHLIARLLSGGAAAGVVLALALAAIAFATVSFSVYFLLLLALTALSFIVFVPMRLAHSIWLLYRRITYQCPYDDCAFNGMPIHVCECGEQYGDLQPSFYGIFHHVCRHVDKQAKLATMNFLGRNKLHRLCGKCERPLVHSALGELPEWPIAIVGGPSAGKTLFMLQGTRQLRQKLEKLPGAAIRFDSEAQQQDFQEKIELLNRGQVVAKTAGDVFQALGLAVSIPKRLRCLLYLFDKPGEDFARVQRFGRMQAMRHIKGLVLLADPFSTPALADYARTLGNGIKPSEEHFSDIVHNLINGVNLMVLRRPDQKCNIPLAVVLSKADALPSQDYPFLDDLGGRNGGPMDEAANERCREALTRLGGGSSVRELEMKFSNIRYFACSALGRLPDLRNTAAFEAHGVAEPFTWLLGVN